MVSLLCVHCINIIFYSKNNNINNIYFYILLMFLEPALTNMQDWILKPVLNGKNGIWTSPMIFHSCCFGSIGIFYFLLPLIVYASFPHLSVFLLNDYDVHKCHLAIKWGWSFQPWKLWHCGKRSSKYTRWAKENADYNCMFYRQIPE